MVTADMKRSDFTVRLFLSFLLVGAPASVAGPKDVAEAALGSRTPGLLLSIGSTDGELELACAKAGWLVQGLGREVDPAAARNRARDAGLPGLASFRAVPDFARLPYADGLANVVVADLDRLGPRAPAREELLRVLAPLGTLRVREDGRWSSVTKPVPPGSDVWEHWDHGADGNPYSTDEGIQPTTTLRWLTGATSVHAAGSKVGLRVADGHVYYTGIDHDVERRRGRSGRNDVFARDAFNGMLRWKRPIEGVPGGGDQPPRFALTAKDGRVYVYPEGGGKLHALDARSGETVVTFDGGPDGPPVTGWDKWEDRIREIHFIVRVFDGKVLQSHRNIVCLSDADTGELLWRRDLGREATVGWAVAAGGRVFLVVSDRPLHWNRASHATPTSRVVALDAGDGGTVWTHDKLKDHAAFRIIHFRDSVIVPAFPWSEQKANFYGGPKVVRLAAATGEVVWSVQDEGKRTRGHYPIVMARGDEIFVGQQGGFGVDFNRGVFTRSYSWGQIDNSCADLKCVPDYTMYGLTFMDEAGERIHRGQTRSICDVGLFPAYGLLYGSPLGCLCSEYVNGYTALGSEPIEAEIPVEERLERGPAFGRTAKGEAAGTGDAWPVYLGDAARGAAVATAVNTNAVAAWETAPLATWPATGFVDDWKDNERIAGLITAPTAGGGKVFVAAPHAHTLFAIDAATGETAWTHTAGGRVDSPPTLVDELAIFGCHDGTVTALRARDGALVWRFLAARNHRTICVHSQLESAWPVSGSVLPMPDGVWVTAGRQSALDGGILIHKLDPRTGGILTKTRVWVDPDRHREEEDSDLVRSRTRNQRVNDILVSNGERPCLWITPLKNQYADGELVDIENRMVPARALRWAAPSKDHLTTLADAKWIWSAQSGGLLSRRLDTVGRHDKSGVNYAELNGEKICRSDDALYVLGSVAPKELKALSGGLVRLTLRADGGLPDGADWTARNPGRHTRDAMIVAGDHIVVADYDPGKDTAGLRYCSTATGEMVAEVALPSRVVLNGLAAAEGRLLVSGTDGVVRAY